MKRWLGIVLLLASCQTVTVRPGGGTLRIDSPDYEEMQSFWMLGLLPEERYIDVSKVCLDKEVEQMQSEFKAVDVFLTVFTLTIFTPRTAKIWCKNPAYGA